MVRGFLAVVVVGVCLHPTPAASFDISSFISTTADTVIKRLYVDQEINLFDHYCIISRSPHISRWELKWQATVTCPGWTPVKGKVRGYSNPLSAEREATRDFVQRIVQRGLVTRDEASEWL
ncbi:anti-lipopolysaccharide factor-like [Portunus trituberculatus]|uniref:anti-lipopolysaccharide factor-like n=1 Tax=Portunus trituberculatus TaxID=210409 RepID=UPI001E1D207D|nr:anti-lipopolysaccharide factor-like [Portunus trituberculatus]